MVSQNLHQVGSDCDIKVRRRVLLFYISYFSLHYIIFCFQFNDRNISSLKTSEWILYTLRTKFVFWDFFLFLPESKSISKFGSGSSSKMLGSGLAIGARSRKKREVVFMNSRMLTFSQCKSIDIFVTVPDVTSES